MKDVDWTQTPPLDTTREALWQRFVLADMVNPNGQWALDEYANDAHGATEYAETMRDWFDALFPPPAKENEDA